MVLPEQPEHEQQLETPEATVEPSPLPPTDDTPPDQSEIGPGHVRQLALQLESIYQARQVPVALYLPSRFASSIRQLDLRMIEGMNENLARAWDELRTTIPIITDDSMPTIQVLGSLRAIVENVLNRYSKHLKGALEDSNVPFELFLNTAPMVEMVAVMLIALDAHQRAEKSSHLVVAASAIQH